MHRQVVIAINISCKFGEAIFINEGDIKVYVKRDEHTDGRMNRHTYRRHFTIFRPRPLLFILSLHSETIAPIIREK